MIPQTSIPGRPVTQAVLDAAAEVGFPVGDGAPPDNRTSSGFPYAVVYALDDAEKTGPISDGQTDVIHVQQVTSVGVTAEQAQDLADAIRTRMKEGLRIDGRVTLLVDVEGGQVTADWTEQPPVFYTADLLRIYTTPV